jgi:adenylosuccinate lyase
MIGPDATITLDFRAAPPGGRDRKAGVYPENMQKNLNKFKRPGAFAARAAGADPGRRLARGRLSAGAAQRHEGLGTGRISSSFWPTPEVTAALPPAEIEEKFDLGYHTKHVDTIFAPGLRPGALSGASPHIVICQNAGDVAF